jgi:hypothetical protein
MSGLATASNVGRDIQWQGNLSGEYDDWMFGVGPSPLTWPLLAVVFAIWGRLFWHELRRNWVSWRAGLVLLILLAVWLYLTSTNGFF